MSEAVTFTVQHGDYMVDERTGEILGLAPERAQFAVTDRSSAEWVLERLAEAESEIAALEARKALYVANVESMQADHQRRADWLRMRFGPELEAFARKALDGQKTRTWKSPFGRLSFRRKPSRLVVHDEEKALAWAKEVQPHAVKVTEKLLLSAIDVGYAYEPPGMHIEPESDSFKIDTGVQS